METCARDLRRLETAVRTVGGSGHYDNLLQQASETVQTAGASGTLTPVRTFRLIEILTGPEAATALYREDKRRTSTRRGNRPPCQVTASGTLSPICASISAACLEPPPAARRTQPYAA